MDENRLLDIRHLQTYFYTSNGVVQAVDDVSFYVNKGETLGLVGESGSGKSVSCMSILRLVETPPGKYVGGEILFNGKDMLKIPDREMREIRGNNVSVIFQEPMTSLNPMHKIGAQISEVLMLHQGMDKAQAWSESIRVLELVRIPNADSVTKRYPFELSGGMRQRAMIAMALACKPQLLIADEPTTALDVTIQAQVLELMNDLKSELNASIIFITHDLGVIAEMADRVNVMYAGKVAESASVEEIFESPKHPYTIGLMNSKPDIATDAKRLTVIPGNVPDLSKRPPGCPFHPRCSECGKRCRSEIPTEIKIDNGHSVYCWKFAEGGVDNV